jgi:hypothetical protein
MKIDMAYTRSIQNIFAPKSRTFLGTFGLYGTGVSIRVCKHFNNFLTLQT